MALTGYMTHYPLLAAMMVRSKGPVLELGVGDYSTPMLHLMCQVAGRELHSADLDDSWLSALLDLSSPGHFFHKVVDWGRFKEIEARHWGLAFVDHAPSERRAIEVARLRDRADFIVVHDTEKIRVYGLEPVLQTFTHRYDWKRYTKWTTVVSMYYPVP